MRYWRLQNRVMSDIEQLNQERQHLMKSFLKVKAELARVRKEKDQLEAETAS